MKFLVKLQLRTDNEAGGSSAPPGYKHRYLIFLLMNQCLMNPRTSTACIRCFIYQYSRYALRTVQFADYLRRALSEMPLAASVLRSRLASRSLTANIVVVLDGELCYLPNAVD